MKEGEFSALVIKLNNGRYFYGISSVGSVLSAWALSGGKMYLNKNQKEFVQDTKRLDNKKVKYEIKVVVLKD